MRLFKINNNLKMLLISFIINIFVVFLHFKINYEADTFGFPFGFISFPNQYYLYNQEATILNRFLFNPLGFILNIIIYKFILKRLLSKII